MDLRVTRRVLVGLALLLLLPAGQAQALGTLEASTVTVDASGFLGPLAGVAWKNPEGDLKPVGTETIELPAFSLAAASAEGTVYHAERYVAFDAEDPAPTSFSLTNVTLARATGDPDARVLATPGAPDAMLALAGPVRLTAGQPGAWQNPPRVSQAPPSVVSTQQALQVTFLEDGLVQLTGSLRLVLDGIDLELITAAGPETIHTRTDVEGEQVNVPPIALAFHSMTHEAVVDLKGATLTMPASQVHVLSATASGRHWSLTSTDGRLSTDGGARSAEADSLNLAGDLEATLQRLDSQRIVGQFTGELDGVSLDGHSVGVAPAPAQAAGAAWVPLAWLALGLALATTLHVASGRWRFKLLDQAMDRKDYAGALRLSQGFRGHPLLAQDAALAAAICLLALERPADAGERLGKRRHWTVRRRPTRDFLLARADAALGRREEASRRLARSLMAEPSLLSQAQADPLLAAILRAARQPPGEAYA